MPENNRNRAASRIPCSRYDKAYFGGTGRGFHARTSGHRADVRHHTTPNVIVVRLDEAGHLPNWKAAEVTHCGLNNQKRKIMEAADIAETNVNCIGQLNRLPSKHKYIIPCTYIFAINFKETVLSKQTHTNGDIHVITI